MPAPTSPSPQQKAVTVPASQPIHPVLAGATLGVMGGGQLGRMFVHAAQAMGYRAAVFTDQADSPAAQPADIVCVGDPNSEADVQGFAEQVDVVTFEFENVPARAALVAAKHAPVRPSGAVLALAQHRFKEKSALRDAGLPVTPFEPVRSREDLDAALERLGTPAVLKTATGGYDGKGQAKIADRDGVDAAWRDVAGSRALGSPQSDVAVDLILEAFIPFQAELSVVAARSANGEVACFDAFENAHANHILDVTVSPARIDVAAQQEAVRIAGRVVEALDVVGVICIEFFLAADGGLLINEIAPRPHNSGHLTIDACEASQFEQQVRAICGLPLGSTRLHRPAAMANLLGDLWADGEPRWDRALAMPGVSLHLYGKREARLGRKMGHLIALAEDPDQAADLARRARAALTSSEAG